jgi:hypothetical protein
MTFTASMIVAGLCAVLFFFAALRSFRRRRIAGGLMLGTGGLALLLLAACALIVAANLRTYQRLSSEQVAGELALGRVGSREYNGTFTFPSGEHADFALRGDEWQVDARVLKWRGLANLVGFDTVYRLDRISGRYTNLEEEKTLPRTVYALSQPDRVDLWEFVHRHQSWIPWIDARYGSATFLPMADGARYELRVSQSGLLARPLNPAARSAVGGWH